MVQLGRRGSVLLVFTDNTIVDDVGVDFQVFGESVEDDYLSIEVSEDGQIWYAYPKRSESPGGLDLAEAGLERVVYVRLTDVQPGTNTGAEVDAVVALHSGPALEEELASLPDALTLKSVTLHQGPDSRMKTVGTLSKNSSLTVVGRSKVTGWAKVRAGDGTSGWCKTANLAMNVSLGEYTVASAPSTPTPTRRPPTPTPTRRATWRVPSLNAQVTSLRFYEAGRGENPPYDQRSYSTRFASSTSRCIMYEINLSHPAPGRRIEITLRVR
jgi:hypothetical protein